MSGIVVASLFCHCVEHSRMKTCKAMYRATLEFYASLDLTTSYMHSTSRYTPDIIHPYMMDGQTAFFSQRIHLRRPAVWECVCVCVCVCVRACVHVLEDYVHISVTCKGQQLLLEIFFKNGTVAYFFLRIKAKWFLQTSRIMNAKILLYDYHHLSHSFWAVFYAAVEFFRVTQNVAVELVRFWNTYSKCLVTHREQTCGWQGGGAGRDGSGVWD